MTILIVAAVITVQYGERFDLTIIGLSNVIEFSNFSATGRSNEIYDGFFSVEWEDKE